MAAACCVLARPRQRRRDRVQRVARAARHARRVARARAHRRHERDLGDGRHRHRPRRRPDESRATRGGCGSPRRSRSAWPSLVGFALAREPAGAPHRSSRPLSRVPAVAGRRDWTRETLAAGIRSRRPSRARTCDHARRERRPACLRPRRRPLSRDRRHVHGRPHRAARRRQVEPDLGAAAPRARARERRSASSRSIRRARSRRARCSATASG